MSKLIDSPEISGRMIEAKSKLDAVMRNNIINIEPINPVDFIGRRWTSKASIRICGISRTWEEADISVLHNKMQQIYAGIYHPGAEFFYCFTGSEKDGFSFYYGADKNDLETIRCTLSGLLDDAVIEDQSVMPGDLCNYLLGGSNVVGGVITGMPNFPGSDDNHWSNPSCAIASGMRGGRFMLVCFCRAVPEDVLNEQQKILRSEQTVAAFNSELTLPGNEINRISQTAVIYDYKQYGAALETMSAHLQDSRSLGAWSVAAYYLACDKNNADRLSSLIRGTIGGDNSFPEQIRCFENEKVRAIISAYQRFGVHDKQHPLAQSVDSGFISYFTTQLSSKQLAGCCIIPDREIPGFYINESARFDLNPRKTPSEGDIKLGNVIESPYSDRIVGEYKFPAFDFDRHVLITGITGGGKSNTIRSVLKTLMVEKGIPFMVIESAKSEYWELTNHGINVCALKLGDINAPFRINPFECADKFSLQTHVDSLFSTFKAAFEMYPPMPYILEQAIYDVYADYGWDVARGTNSRRIWQYPSLSDLYYQIPITVRNSSYDKEIKDNITGSLQTRIRSLMIGGKGRMLDCRRSTPMEDLLKIPLVLELENLGDDDTKSFVIGLLMSRLYELRRVQSAGKTQKFSHLLIIEEAHRLLRRTMAGGPAGDPKAAAVEYFCNMLTEIRSYGQGILIADQSPEKIAEDAVRNTNLKIAHRIVDENDRKTMAGAMHMDSDQTAALSILGRGVAAVYSEGDHCPRLVKMPLMIPKLHHDRNFVLQRSVTHPVFRDTGEDSVGGYCTCRYCSFFQGGTCRNEGCRKTSQQYADYPLTDKQCRYYEREFQHYGADGALLWAMIRYAFTKNAKDQGNSESSGIEMVESLDHNTLICIAGRILERLAQLDPKFCTLCADRFENFLVRNLK